MTMFFSLIAAVALVAVVTIAGKAMGAWVDED